MGSKTAAIMAEVRASNERALESRKKSLEEGKVSVPYSYTLGSGESHAGGRVQPSRYTGEGAHNSDWEKECSRLTGIGILSSDDNVIGALPPRIPMTKAVAFLRGFPVFATVDENVLRQIVTASGVNPRNTNLGRRPHHVTELIGSCSSKRKGSGVLTGIKVPVIWCTCTGLEGRFCLQHDKSNDRGRSYVRSA